VIKSALKEELRSFKQPPQKTNNDLLTFIEARKLLNISASTLHKWKRDNIIPVYRIGGRIYFKQSDVDDKINKSIPRNV